MKTSRFRKYEKTIKNYNKMYKMKAERLTR